MLSVSCPQYPMSFLLYDFMSSIRISGWNGGSKQPAILARTRIAKTANVEKQAYTVALFVACLASCPLLRWMFGYVTCKQNNPNEINIQIEIYQEIFSWIESLMPATTGMYAATHFKADSSVQMGKVGNGP